MKVLLTGGHGMVGRNIADTAPDSLDLLTPDRATLDLLDCSALESWLKIEKPDAIVHAAGIVGGIQANIEEPFRFLHDNTIMGFNLVRAARDCGVKKLLNLGSSCMYPRFGENPLKESSILTGELEPTNEGYAIAKIATARLCEFTSREDPSFLYRTAIPCNIYGEYDAFFSTKSHMVPAAIRKVVQAKKENSSVEIWGDGLVRREFMYSVDLANFVIFALNKMDEMPHYLNVGLGRDYTINEYYQTIAKLVGFTGEFVHDTTKPTGMKQKLVDTTRLDEFGWQPAYTLEAGLKATLEHFEEVNAS